ncbi:MAG TPA: BON domain-containing protein [Nitrospira sp.]|nr:BON domain-containing protein [Nitrospira sp.]
MTLLHLIKRNRTLPWKRVFSLWQDRRTSGICHLTDGHFMRQWHSLSCWLFVLSSTAGCFLPVDNQLSAMPRDSVISANVESQLAGEGSGGFSNILVDTEGGTVTLTGTVERAERKARAAELARQVKGVKRVKNDLEIRADGAP